MIRIYVYVYEKNKENVNHSGDKIESANQKDIIIEDNEVNDAVVNSSICLVCEERFENESVLTKHMEEHVSIPQIDGNVDIGNRGFFIPPSNVDYGNGRFNLTAFEINPCADVKNMWYQCDNCDYHSSTATGLNKHKKKKHKT